MGSTAWNAPNTAVDTSGLTTALTTPQSGVDDIRTGTAFRSDVLAAGRLVHVHPSVDGRYLAVFSERWTAATPKPTLPGEYSAKTVVTRPAAFWVSPHASTEHVIIGGGIGQVHSSTDLQAIAGASHNHLMVLLCTIGGVGALVRYRVDGRNVNVVSSQYLSHSFPATGAAVVWNRGVHISGTYLYVLGGRESGELFLMKLLLTHGAQSPLYLGARGWTGNQEDLYSLRDKNNAVLTSRGPVSVARYGNEWYLSTVVESAGSYSVRFHRAGHPASPWQKLSSTVSLGSDSKGAAFFQSSVQANPDHPDVSMPEVVAGLPVVYNVQQGDALRTRWRVLGVPRFRL